MTLSALHRKQLSVMIPLLLMVFCVLLNLHGSASGANSSHLSQSAASTLIGGNVGGCAIAVGAVGALAALAIGGATVGFGAALVISATIQIGAVACAS